MGSVKLFLHVAVAFLKAWELEPSRVESALNLTLTHTQLGQRAEAKVLLARILTLAEQLPEGHLNLPSLLAAESDRAGAIRHYRRFLDITAGHDSPLRAQVAGRLATLTER